MKKVKLIQFSYNPFNLDNEIFVRLECEHGYTEGKYLTKKQLKMVEQFIKEMFKDA